MVVAIRTSSRCLDATPTPRLTSVRVADWEYARRGDPAYDLAIVTRGIKQPFHIDRGLDRLRDADRAHGGHDILDDQVHLYELSLIAGWYRAALSGCGAHPPAHELDRMRSLLRRLR